MERLNVDATSSCLIVSSIRKPSYFSDNWYTSCRNCRTLECRPIKKTKTWMTTKWIQSWGQNWSFI